MSKVFVHTGMSLDGFVAGVDRGPATPLGHLGMKVHEWLFHQRAFRENLKLGEGGETGVDNELLEATTKRTGANVMGKRMFQEGEANRPEEAPFHTPVFVLTHERREPWERPGGTTFYFVTDGIESALDQARRAAGAGGLSQRGIRESAMVAGATFMRACPADARPAGVPIVRLWDTETTAASRRHPRAR